MLSKTTSGAIKICAETVFIPNSFSPNKDGHNDIFKAIVSRQLSYFSLRIYNRFGQNVFRSKDSSIGWDGTFYGVNQPIGLMFLNVLTNFPKKRVKR